MKEIIKRIIPNQATDLLRSWVWREMSPRWVTKSGVAICVKSPAEWVLYNDIFVDREYDEAINMALSESKRRPLIIDIGANVGFFSLRVMDQWNGRSGEPRIVGFEGAPSVYQELIERVDQPCLSDCSEYHMGLVGKRQGTAKIHTSRFHAVNSVAVEGVEHSHSSEVEYLDVEEYIPEEEEISLIKCDIEGAEHDFVSHYERLIEKAKNMIIEIHGTESKIYELEEEIMGINFQGKKVVSSGEDTKVVLFSG
jgi:FkbM family methyltransferase